MPSLRPLFLRYIPLEIGEGPWEEGPPRSRSAGLARPQHLGGALLRRRFFGPLVSLLVADDTLVGRAPPDLDGDARPGLAQRGDVLPSLESVVLPWAGFVRSHTPDGCL